MNDKLLDLLNHFKHQQGFPPREKTLVLKQQFNDRGILTSSIAATEITKAYIESATAVLENFSEAVLRNKAALGLLSEDEVSGVFQEAFDTISKAARSNALGEFSNRNDLSRWIEQTCDQKFPPLLEQLQRKVRLRDMDFGGMMNPVQITDSQIGNLVLGSVNQSELTATANTMVKNGGAEAELGKAIRSLIEVVGKMTADRKPEQAELFDLLKGLLQQVKLPEQDRSRSTIKVIWDRVREVSQVSSEVAQAVQTILPSISALLGQL
ncbi:MAG: hypothetical protein AB7L09_26480 [Nitrospira sp.]